MPGRTDLNPAFRPTVTSTATPAVPVTPQVAPPSVEQLINKAVAGTLTPDEAHQLAAMLDSPQGRDAFTPEQRKDLQGFMRGNAGMLRNAEELTSDLSKVKEAGDIPERFLADLALAREALLEHASLLRAQKATRMFQFAVPYVKLLNAMTDDPALFKAVAAQMLIAAEKAGFKDLLKDPGGESGLRVLKELLKLRSPDDINRMAQELRFDAPIWPKDPIRQSDGHRNAAIDEHEHLKTVATAKGGQPEMMRPLPPVMLPPVPVRTRPDDPIAIRKDDKTSRRLSPMTLWNALHTLRDAGGEGQESAAQREAKTQVAIAAIGILALFAILVGVLVAL